MLSSKKYTLWGLKYNQMWNSNKSCKLPIGQKFKFSVKKITTVFWTTLFYWLNFCDVVRPIWNQKLWFFMKYWKEKNKFSMIERLKKYCKRFFNIKQCHMLSQGLNMSRYSSVDQVFWSSYCYSFLCPFQSKNQDSLQPPRGSRFKS
jgi:hypothetical protein